MRGAAQRIAILQAVRIAQRRLGHQVGANACRHALLTRVGFGGKQGLIKMVCIARNTHHIGRCDAAGQLTHILSTLPGQAGQCCHHGCAIHQRQAFLGAQPQGRGTGQLQCISGRHALIFIEHLTLATQDCGHIRQGRQITAGTHRAFGWNQRQDVVQQKMLQLLHQRPAHPRHTLRQRCHAAGQHGTRFFRRQIAARTAAMVGVQVVG